MALWKRLPQECKGSYLFSGTLYTTLGVADIPLDEIMYIYQDVRDFADQEDGISKVQIYVNDDGEKLYCVDRLNREALLTGRYVREDNYCTLLTPEEY